MEFGPRALGNRSILADPRDPHMQKKLNLKAKYRESFRPFAPSVLRKQLSEWFDIDVDSPYMLMVAPVHARHRREMTSEVITPPRADGASRDQSALPRSYQPLSRADRVSGPGQHQLQRAQRADRMHARGCLPLLHGLGDRALAAGNCYLVKDEQDPALKQNYKDEFEPD